MPTRQLIRITPRRRPRGWPATAGFIVDATNPRRLLDDRAAPHNNASSPGIGGSRDR